MRWVSRPHFGRLDRNFNHRVMVVACYSACRQPAGLRTVGANQDRDRHMHVIRLDTPRNKQITPLSRTIKMLPNNYRSGRDVCMNGRQRWGSCVVNMRLPDSGLSPWSFITSLSHI